MEKYDLKNVFGAVICFLSEGLPCPKTFRNNDLSTTQTKLLERERLVTFFAFLSSDECRGLTQEACDISPVLTQAMEALQDRPVLYK